MNASNILKVFTFYNVSNSQFYEWNLPPVSSFKSCRKENSVHQLKGKLVKEWIDQLGQSLTLKFPSECISMTMIIIKYNEYQVIIWRGNLKCEERPARGGINNQLEIVRII